MASKSVVAKRRLDATRRLEEVMSVLGEKFGVEAPHIPQRGRDPMLLQARQLEVLAGWAEDLAATVGTMDVVGDAGTPDDADDADTPDDAADAVAED